MRGLPEAEGAIRNPPIQRLFRIGTSISSGLISRTSSGTPQAMQSMFHFRIKADPAFDWGVPELVREIKPDEMNVPIKNKR